MRDIGKNIRDIRLSKNMTQDMLAEALFVTRQTVSNYENGRSRPDIDMVLRIAEVLGTDANSIIFGLPFPESKKRAYKRLWIAVSALAVAVIGYFVIEYIVKIGDYYGMHNLKQINRTTLLPAVFFIFGWVLMHLLGMFCKLQPLKIKWIKAAKRTAWVVAGLLAVLLIPYDVFEILVMIRYVGATSLSMSFPYIPVYQEVSCCVLLATIQFPFLYVFLGGMFWLVGIPNSAKTDQP